MLLFSSAAMILEDLTKFQSRQDLRLHRPLVPLYHAQSVLQSIGWLERHLKTYLPFPETLYHVLHRVFHQIFISPLLNEQMRGLNAICLLCAVYAPAFKDSSGLLRCLIYGAVSLLSHSYISHRAQSILDWAFDIYLRNGVPDSRLPEALVRIANVASTSKRGQSPSASASEGDLAVWVEALSARFHSDERLAFRFLCCQSPLAAITPQVRRPLVSSHTQPCPTLLPTLGMRSLPISSLWCRGSNNRCRRAAILNPPTETSGGLNTVFRGIPTSLMATLMRTWMSSPPNLLMSRRLGTISYLSER